MNTIEAYMRGLAAKANGTKVRVFDWDKAARLIKEAGATYASAGLIEDYDWTGRTILKDGKPELDELSCTYLASNWATPVLIIDDVIECWRYAEDVPDWDARTLWPDSAKHILESASSPAKNQEKGSNEP